VIPSIVLMCLYFGKKGKPDGYLIHLLRYVMSHGYYSASEFPINELKMKESIIE